MRARKRERERERERGRKREREREREGGRVWEELTTETLNEVRCEKVRKREWGRKS